MHNILITGASGMIGTRLTQLLIERGHRVVHLSRAAKDGAVKTFVWDVARGYLDAASLANVDTIIHLAGAGVADKRWTPQRKKEILESRVQSTLLLYNALKKGGHNVRSFVSASAIGYYGFHDNEKLFKETDRPGNDFLSTVVKQWEESSEPIKTLGIRVVKIRIGIVLSDEGGALKEMAKPIALFAGAPLGSGKQNLSWIHIDDVCNMFIKAVTDDHMEGVYNGTGAYAVSNEVLTRAIAKVLNRPLILPHVPSFILKLLFGELANVVLNGSRVSAEKIQQAGFKYSFPDLENALKNLLKR